jgi:hypothetical protein
LAAAAFVASSSNYLIVYASNKIINIKASIILLKCIYIHTFRSGFESMQQFFSIIVRFAAGIQYIV